MDRSHKLMMNGDDSSAIRRRRGSRYLTSAFADRYYDDLAVRRLSKPANQQADSKSAQSTCMSYLLCSNAYTPAAGASCSTLPKGGAGQAGANFYDSLERRVRADDLQFRQHQAKNRLDPHEPPFGIPRQAGVHSSASHYLRRQQQPPSIGTATDPTLRVCHCSTPARAAVAGYSFSPNERQLSEKVVLADSKRRTDSRVSFLDDRTGGTSADSGLAGGSPALSEAGGLSRLATPISKLAHDGRDGDGDEGEDDAAEEINLDDQLWRNSTHLDDGDPSRCESPAVERFRAQFGATPTRRRPKINIEQPRAKSPLLRVSSRPLPPPVDNQSQAKSAKNADEMPQVQVRCYEDSTRPVSEIECRYDFESDEDLDFHDVDGPKVRTSEQNPAKPKYITTNSLVSSSSNNEQSPDESLAPERLNYRAGCSKRTAPTKSPLGTEDTRISSPMSTTTRAKLEKDGPIFSIGQYRPLNKPNLKIL